jgi:membrane-associated phospholipid phosphatase
VAGALATTDATRHRRDAWLVVGGLVLLAVAWLPVDANQISDLEESVFNFLNDLPNLIPYRIGWFVMQFGSLLAVPIVATAAILANRNRLAASIALAGLAAYLLARVLKDLADRGRPAAFFESFERLGDVPTGHGFPSGHAAVAFAMAVVLWPWLTRGWRWVPLGVAVFVCVSRIHVGAHLPLDVVGGAALGIVCAGAVRLVLGRP